MPISRSTGSRRLVATLALGLGLALVVPGAAPAQTAPVTQTQAAASPSGVRGHVGALATSWKSTHGAGQNARWYNDTLPRWSYDCVGERPIFKITRAHIYMWSKGERIKGLQFKYRLVAGGTEGQPQWWTNWSANTSVSFTQNKPYGRWMNAPGLGQSFSSLHAWDMEIKLKYPRSKRTAFRYKYRVRVPSPQCGVLATR